MWHGTAGSVVDLHPSGYAASGIAGADAGYQVGAAYPDASTLGNSNTISHALMWHGTATDIVNLHPAGFTHSSASDVSGTTQVGSGRGPSTENQSHALLWNGTAASVVDLHPTGFARSSAVAAWGSMQLGNGFFSAGSGSHALLWSGSAESVVDLTPAAKEATANDLAGELQVGNARRPGITDISHAYLWRGTAASAVDLHPYVVAALGPQFVFSNAFHVTERGEVYGLATNTDQYFYAVKWSPVPEPGSQLTIPLTLIVGMLGLRPKNGRRQFRGRNLLR
jgi:hypothetical protein